MKKEKNQTAAACKIAAAKKTSIGGQALMEGIMMRGPQMTAMAVRKTSGEIVLEKWKTQSKKVSPLLKLPIIRGVYGFISSMTTGYKALMRSAELSGLEELEEEMAREKAEKKKAKKAKKANKSSNEAEVQEAGATAAEETAAEAVAEEPAIAEATVTEAISEEITNDEAYKTDSEQVQSTDIEAEKPNKEKKKSSPLTTAIMVIASVLGIALAVGLFIMLPSFLYELIPFPAAVTENHILNSFVKSAFEGILKIALLVGYMALVSLMKDIRRTFQYHGAEHKTIFCYESGMELTVENVRNQRRFHPRCGTAFLVLMLIVGMFVSFFIDPIIISIYGPIPDGITIFTAIRALLKLATLPIVMGIGYELIKIAGRHDNIITRIISAPGLWLQRLTVLEPTDDMIECAIIAFKEVIPPDQSDNY